MSEEGEVQEGVVKEPVVITKAQHQQKENQRIRFETQRRQAATKELAYYKKRVSDANSLKSIQVEELELNIRYYKAKKEWFDLLPKVEELDALEQAMQQKQEAERAAHQETMKKAAEEEPVTNEQPEIVVPKVGKPRE